MPAHKDLQKKKFRSEISIIWYIRALNRTAANTRNKKRKTKSWLNIKMQRKAIIIIPFFVNFAVSVKRSPVVKIKSENYITRTQKIFICALSLFLFWFSWISFFLLVFLFISFSALKSFQIVCSMQLYYMSSVIRC